MRIALICIGLFACRSHKIIMVDEATIVDQDADGVEQEQDCDDLNAEIWPEAEGWTADCEEVSDTTQLEDTDLKVSGGCSSIPNRSVPFWLTLALGLLFLRPRRQREP